MGLPRYQLVENRNGEWSVRLVAGNGETLAVRESSAARSNARRAVRAIVAAAHEAQFSPIEVVTLAEVRQRWRAKVRRAGSSRTGSSGRRTSTRRS